ncbi:ATP-binding domain-containing protein, partial [Eubacteriales bacterium OttesenSCG-928-K08]|nr:ATP-binding domain-containing protein [Eubacteriales bacterium OttesenSCG-928-K08]
NGVINNNVGRKRKKLWTEQKGGDQIGLYHAMNERAEAEYIAKHILFGARQDRRYDEFAVLYRTNAQSRVIETVLTSYGIPYRVYGGVRFYERAEVKDILAYLRLLYNPADDVAFQRVINVPRRGIGTAALGELATAALDKGAPLFLAAMDGEGLSPRVQQKMKAFTEDMSELLMQRESMPLNELVEELIKRVNYDAYLRDDKKENYEARCENISELLGAMQEFERGLPEDADVLGAYLENVSLISDIDNLEEKDGQVALMTLHSAKGLEFPVVFIAGMEENIFPSRRSKLDTVKMEEERRLCYVGITRAKQQLHLVHARQRSLYGELQANPPSRFLEEIPAELVNEAGGETASQTEKKTSYKQAYTPPVHGGFGGQRSAAAPDVPRPSNESGGKEFRLHQQVRHAKFGSGTILQVEGSGTAQVVTIDFGSVVKKFAAGFAPIEPVD